MSLDDAREKLTEGHGLHDGCLIQSGWDSALAFLREASGEFDYAESRIAFQNHAWPMIETISQHTYWVEGQRAQFTKDREIVNVHRQASIGLTRMLGEAEARVKELEASRDKYAEAMAVVMRDGVFLEKQRTKSAIEKILGVKL